MSHDFWVTLHGPRGAEWSRVLGVDPVCMPVVSPIPSLANLPGYDIPQRVYFLALDQLEPGQLDAIVSHMSRKFDLDPEETAREITAAGIPILESQCSVIVHNPQRWFCADRA